MKRLHAKARLGIIGAAFLAGVLGAGAVAFAQDEDEVAGDASKAATVRDLTNELSLADAKKSLEGTDPADPALAVERARVALYEGDCVEAVRLLTRPDLEDSHAAMLLAQVSRGCERSTAGAVVHEAPGVWIRFQDDADVVLAPLLDEVIASARELFVKDLGVTLQDPIRVEVVRDQMALSAMTGLPLAAARTTGTIGIAKWGRVVMVSPRAASNGYAFLDTLAHELTHIALTRGSRDRAPLWLQEGVARTEESRWREALPFDDSPAADAVALYGVHMKIGPDIDKIGPSIALLPSAAEAQITYAKVQSFMKYYAAEAGPDAMQKLLAGFKEVDDPEQLDKVIEKVSGTTFEHWGTRWSQSLEAHPKDLPDELRPDAKPKKELKDVRKRVRLGELLLDRDHADAASRELAKGHDAMPKEALVRALYARALSRFGKEAEARALVEKPEDVLMNEPVWWSMRAKLGVGDKAHALKTAIALAPYDPLVACGELDPPALPDDPILAKVCTAARDKPRER